MTIGISPSHFAQAVVNPTLMILAARTGKTGMDSASAKKLIIGTALVESRLKWLYQLGNGPARGVFQMEPTTFYDHIEWLKKHETLQQAVSALTAFGLPHLQQLEGNLYFACAMCRVHYWRIQEPLPEANDLYGIADYWKKHYNTYKGKGSAAQFMQVWHDSKL